MRRWFLINVGLGGLLLASGVAALAGGDLGSVERQSAQQSLAVGGLLLVLGTVAFVQRRRLSRFLDREGGRGLPRQLEDRPYFTLFLISFVALFVEVMLIRYASAQLRIFAFYKNVPLIAAFLGLGVGAWKGGADRTTVLRYLLWMLPFAAFFGHGVGLFDGILGQIAVTGSSEHILAQGLSVERTRGVTLLAQVVMGGVCTAVFLVTALMFVGLGRLLGDAFGDLPRLRAYAVNLAGSLAGILGFVLLSYAETPPWVWFSVGLFPLLWWLGRRRPRLVASALVIASALTVAPAVGDTVWSPYQKLVGQEITVRGPDDREAVHGYLVRISDVFYQVALDLSPEAIDRMGFHPYPYQDSLLNGISDPGRVLVVGSGTGNDVAAVLRAGASHVDAVDIDPAIVQMGRRHHPERPYQDERVEVIVNDARAAFRNLPRGSYGAIVFGALDSHTQLGMSSVRLDNYVYTEESFAAARRLLEPGGRFVVTAVTLSDWMRDRIVGLLQTVCASPVEVSEPGSAFAGRSYRCSVGEGPPPGRSGLEATSVLPTDDWPFFYLPNRTIPSTYAIVLLLLAIAAVLLLRDHGLAVAGWTSSRFHFFFLGAGFLLMEVYIINRLALLFGTTWLVSAAAIAAVLLVALGANGVVIRIPDVSYVGAYAALLIALAAGILVEPSSVVGASTELVMGYVAVLVAPVFFGGLVFARSFAGSAAAGPAIGANILGSVLGGLAEYSSMALGMEALAALAAVLYLASAGALLQWAKGSNLERDEARIGATM